jgi:hypothetical protein
MQQELQEENADWTVIVATTLSLGQTIYGQLMAI